MINSLVINERKKKCGKFLNNEKTIFALPTSLISFAVPLKSPSKPLHTP